jgi:hypothetical protein
MRVAEEQGLASFLGQATIYSGATLAQKGQTSEGISRIRQGLRPAGPLVLCCSVPFVSAFSQMLI